MNILEITDQFDHIQSQNCKVNYLNEQNKLMQRQCLALNEISNTYKKLLDYVTSRKVKQNIDNQNDENQIKQRQDKILQLLNESNQTIQKWQNRWNEEQEKQKEQNQQPNISDQFFLKMVLSYQQSISNLKAQIKSRQNTLQQYEKNIHKNNKDIIHQNNVVVNAIQSYDIYNRIADRCRQEIMTLKLKMNQIKNNKMQKLYGKMQTKLKYNNEKQTDKTIKKMSVFKQNQISLPDDKISTFEKTILLYKKKKILNQIRQSKLIELKTKIKQKQYCNRILKKKIQQSNWQQLVQLDYINKHQALQNIDSFSVYGCSDISNLYDFSIDLSKVIPQTINKKKNYAQYKAQSKFKH